QLHHSCCHRLLSQQPRRLQQCDQLFWLLSSRKPYEGSQSPARCHRWLRSVLFYTPSCPDQYGHAVLLPLLRKQLSWFCPLSVFKFGFEKGGIAPFSLHLAKRFTLIQQRLLQRQRTRLC